MDAGSRNFQSVGIGFLHAFDCIGYGRTLIFGLYQFSRDKLATADLFFGPSYVLTRHSDGSKVESAPFITITARPLACSVNC